MIGKFARISRIKHTNKLMQNKNLQNEKGSATKKALGTVVSLIVGPSIAFGGIGLGLVSFLSVISFFSGDR